MEEVSTEEREDGERKKEMGLRDEGGTENLAGFYFVLIHQILG